jgi:hypothetical protein
MRNYKRRVLFCTNFGVGYVFHSQAFRMRLSAINELKFYRFSNISLAKIVGNSTQRITDKIWCQGDNSSFPTSLSEILFPYSYYLVEKIFLVLILHEKLISSEMNRQKWGWKIFLWEENYCSCSSNGSWHEVWRAYRIVSDQSWKK